jgi:MFS family permease
MRLGLDLDVLRLRDFRLVFGASVASLLGDGVVPVALAFAVLDLTGSATDLGIVLAARVVALISALLALLLSGHATVAELAASQVLLGAASGFFNPASSGLVPLVAGEHLQQANTLKGIAMAGGNIAGPAIAGALVVGTGPGAALLIDAASYGISALLLVRVARVTQPHAPRHPFAAELREAHLGLGRHRLRGMLEHARRLHRARAGRGQALARRTRSVGCDPRS